MSIQRKHLGQVSNEPKIHRQSKRRYEDLCQCAKLQREVLDRNRRKKHSQHFVQELAQNVDNDVSKSFLQFFIFILPTYSQPTVK